jgi:3-dehydroquinate synthase
VTASATIRVPLGASGYDVVVGDGLLADLPGLLERHCHAARYAIITDTTVAPLLGERMLANLSHVAPCTLCTFPAGEWNKTREAWIDLSDKLLAAGVGRDGAIVALGGGVVGDLAGFVAATYMRGIPYVQVPTTVLAMVDSSVGGKTGVDTRLGKNLIGAFHQPRGVFADVATLQTLPKPQVAAGLAEALKHGAIADEAYFHSIVAQRERLLARDAGALHDVIRRSIEIKVAVVQDDEREQGKRAILNFGHTVGHAVEAAAGYQLLHGEAVAVGMVVEAELGKAIGITDPGAVHALSEAIRAFGLPATLPAGLSGAQLTQGMASDKKARSGSVRFALLQRLGAMAKSGSAWTRTIPEDTLAQVLGSLSS